MTSTSPRAFALSAALHAVVVTLAFVVGFATRQSEPPEPKIIELVAGAGDNFMGTEAPKLGTPGGVKMKLPDTPVPKPTPPAPVEPEPAPIAPAPTPPQPKAEPPPQPPKPVKVAPKAPDSITDFPKAMKQKTRAAENKAKKEVAKERAAEEKRQQEAEKRMSKEEYDRTHKQKTVASVSPKAINPKQIDVDGIKEGVVKGTSKAPGSGGKALTSDNADVLAGYYAIFNQKLRAAFEPPPGLADTLKVTIEVRSNADGSLTGARIVKTSGVKEFDQAVLDAIKRVRMPARPDKKSEPVEFNFSMRERSEG